jgi:hypothetical protein
MLNPAPFKKSIEKLPVVDSVVVTVIVAVPLVSISVVGKLPEVEIVLACLFSNVHYRHFLQSNKFVKHYLFA